MNWSELDALADELRRTLARGGLRNLPAITSDHTHTLTPALLARITLADIDHVRGMESGHPWERPSALRLHELASAIRQLLKTSSAH
jgi:hypothetical protein